MTQFTVRALRTNELAAAWPVARSSNLYANIDWWLSDAAELIAGGGGVLAALGLDGSIYGVAAFKLPDNPARDNVVTISLLVTFELRGRAPVRHALIKALEGIATKLECTHVVLPLTANYRTPRPAKLFAAAW